MTDMETPEFKYPMTCPVDHIHEVNVCGNDHTNYCPVHGLDLWYDTCWGCHTTVDCKACIAWSDKQAGRSMRWVRRTLRIVGMRLHCIDKATGKPFKLAAWATTLPRAMRRFAAHSRGITFLGT